MALTLNSKVSELLKDPKAKAVVASVIPEILTDIRWKGPARSMTLLQIAPMSGGFISKAKLDAIQAGLEKIQ